MPKYDYEKVIELNKKGYSIVEISKMQNIPETSVKNYFHYHNIKNNKKGFVKYNDQEVLELNSQGLSISQICKKFNAPYSSIYSIITRSGNDINEVNYDYDKIREMINNGFTVVDISEKIGINKKHLYESLKKKGIEINKESKLKYKKVLELNSEGKTIRQICDITGFLYDNVHAYFYRNDINYNEDNGILTGYSFFPMDEYRAYFLGLIFGDGALGKSDNKCIELGMNDLDIIDRINQNIFDNKITIGAKRLESGKMHYRLNIYNSIIWQELVDNFGLINNKSAIMQFPKNISEELLPHFVRGLVDSDGSFYYSDNKLAFSYVSCSKNFVYDLKKVLQKYCGINDVKIYESKRDTNNLYGLKLCNKKDPKAIGRWIYKDSENNRGERKFSKWLNK